ncbi:MAG: AMP-binding protein [Proteobacteria bacterium]|nr:AMP-binding protein [Pseudomonadota bacterium]HQR02806.1 AMP-binding protein [Rhodocyclaceae bacterium]
MSDIVDRMKAALAQITSAGAPFELVTVDVDGRPCKAYKNAPRSVSELVNQGRQHGDATFLVYQNERWTFNQFFRAVDTFTAKLQTVLGVGKGDRVAVAMRNRPEWAITFCAAINTGAVVIPVNSWSQREELVHILGNAEPRVLICDNDRLAHVAADLDTLGCKVVAVDGPSGPDPACVIRYDALCASAADPVAVDLGPDDPVMIMYTSGTTSGAKGVLSANRAFCQAVTNIDCVGMAVAMTSPEKIKAMMARGLQPSSLLAVPLFHVSGLQAQFIGALKGGRKLVIMYKWDIDTALDLIVSEQVTSLNLAPAMMQQLLTAPRFDRTDTSAINGAGFGGSATPGHLIELAFAKLPMALPGTGYGMTESNATASSCTDLLFREYPKSSGLVAPIVEVCCKDDLGNEIPRGQTGEICLRGITVMLGYWRNEAATADTVRDGWLHTGDIGYVSAENLIYVVDRIKDIVNRGGEKIATIEIESCVHQMPAVAEAAAFAVPDATYGEVVGVAVVPREGATISAEEVKRHVAQHLAAYKVPAHVAVLEQTLPRNATGKVIKRALKDLVLGGQV